MQLRPVRSADTPFAAMSVHLDVVAKQVRVTVGRFAGALADKLFACGLLPAVAGTRQMAAVIGLIQIDAIPVLRKAHDHDKLVGARANTRHDLLIGPRALACPMLVRHFLQQLCVHKAP